MKKAIICILAVSVAVSGLTACGVKPGNVQPPVGATDVYPRVYPDPAHSNDPGPEIVIPPQKTEKTKE